MRIIERTSFSLRALPMADCWFLTSVPPWLVAFLQEAKTRSTRITRSSRITRARREPAARPEKLDRSKDSARQEFRFWNMMGPSESTIDKLQEGEGEAKLRISGWAGTGSFGKPREGEGIGKPRVSIDSR